MSDDLAADVVVVGAGVAGAAVALAAAAGGRRVALLVKGELGDGSSRWAQGGLAAVLDPRDSLHSHVRDTLEAGAGLCDPEVVTGLVAQAPGAVARLTAMGAVFDRAAGQLALGREGGHEHHRIVHAGGDASGREIMRVLVAALRESSVRVREQVTVTDVLLDEGGQAAGVDLLDATGRTLRLTARAVVLATGGSGQVYASTTNPAAATGDGLGLALRAGATVLDAEFVQFHPTALWSSDVPADGRRPLVTEALRGAGAVLVDGSGQRVMAGVHPREDLAPRDVVSAALHARMRQTGSDHLYLDATSLGEPRLEGSFPTVVAACRDVGVDPVHEPIPVAPAAHYQCGGVRADLEGRTDVTGLYAVGEVARTGVHGANRLASNSLLEAIVYSKRIIERTSGRDVSPSAPLGTPDDLRLPLSGRPGPELFPAPGLTALQQLLW
ncbi:MAG TPA: L-aspartate oxidase, partial [Pedococcus sp.]